MKKRAAKIYASPTAKEIEVIIENSIMQSSIESYEDEDDWSELWEEGQWE